ncbi:MAG: MMPL family transporter [Gammaproteobacteria bacterium]|nr:MMPL family transporter [Gammaproteobacteria bacterium]
MTRSLAARWLCLVVLLGLGAGIIATRLSLTYDLAYFLPQPVTDAQRILLDRVGQGPGAQLLYITLPGADSGQRDAVAGELADLDGVRRVLPGVMEPAVDAIPGPLFEHRYLLADVDTSVAGLRQALRARLRDLAGLDDPQFLDLVAADPHLVSIGILEALGGAAPDEFRLPDGTPYLLLDTAPPAFDLGAQQVLLESVRNTLADIVPGVKAARLYGAGAYGLALQGDVRRESTWFSIAAAAALTVLLWVAYRGPAAVLLASLPLLAGAVAGLAVLALLFPRVHGITLAFGFTLMGVTVDYGLHVLSHVRLGGRRALTLVWPTLLLSAASSALAFLAFALSGSRGLVQLGVFSAAGIVAAAFAAWLLLPRLAGHLIVGSIHGRASGRLEVGLRYWPALLAMAVGGALLAVQEDVWNDDLSSLTPVPAATLAVDRQLRQRSNAPDLRYLLVSRGASEGEVLQRVARLERTLQHVRAEGVIDGYQAVTRLVPDPATQRRRAGALNAAGLEERLEAAAAGLPIRAAALAPFVAAVQQLESRGGRVSTHSYAGTALSGMVNAMVYPDRDGWVALTFLQGLDDPAALAGQEALPDDTLLVDLQAASQALLVTYRNRLLLVLAGALLLVTLLLGVFLGSTARLAWVVGTVTASLLLAAPVAALLLGSLSLFDLVALALVAGLGLDYALFFSRPQRGQREYRATQHALGVCLLSTVTVFGLLSLSTIPVLHGIGVSVSTGVCLAFLLAWSARYVRPAT